jgi:tRNA A-37 threonylcarbamoyl transferase component Bud32
MNQPDDAQDFHEPDEIYQPGSGYSEIVTRLLPSRWRLNVGPTWTQAIGPKRLARVQGWKIHLSSTLDNAERTLEIATHTCSQRATEFKFASDEYRHRRLLSKNMGRQSAGKFVTIYPPNDDVFETLLEDLYARCNGLVGPYILSDRQYKDSAVVFYRYGGFVSFTDVDVFRQRRSLILDDHFGYIEDQRLPSVHVPPFAVDRGWGQEAGADATPMEPSGDVLRPAEVQAAANDTNFPTLGGRFETQSAFKQTNVGGIYLARDIVTGKSVVIREARPMTDPDVHGQDAVLRLRREHAILELLETEGIGPAPMAFFEEWTHSFLAVAHVPGRSLRQVIVSRSPTLHAHSSEDMLREWLDLSIMISRNLIDQVMRMHARGVVFGDISTNNIMLDEATGTVTLVDFETAFRPGIDLGHNAFTPGFGRRERLQRGTATFSDDIIGVGAVMLALLIPSHCNLALIDDFEVRALRMLRADIGLPDRYVQPVECLLGGQPGALAESQALLESIDLTKVHQISVIPTAAEFAELPAMLEGLVDYVEAALDIEHPWRLFPPDPGYHDVMAFFEHGAAGVAFGLRRLRGRVPTALESWLRKSASQDCETPGLLNGLAGMGWTFSELGLHDHAREVLDRTSRHKLLYSDASLGYGLAGIGLCHLRLWCDSGEPIHFDQALHVANVLAETAVETPIGTWWPVDGTLPDEPKRIGLHAGAAGVALFLLYAYCASGREDLLALAIRALDYDLSFERTLAGSVGFPRVSHGDSASVVYPYLEHGAAGVATVALRLYHVTKQPALLAFLNRVNVGVAQRYTIGAGLGAGLAGLGNYLLDGAQFLGDSSLRELAGRCATGLLVFQVRRSSGIAVPARLGGTVSCSYLEGAVGVALFIDRLLRNGPAFHFSLDTLLETGRTRTSRTSGGLCDMTGLVANAETFAA